MSDYKWGAIVVIAFMVVMVGAMLAEQYIDKLPDNSGERELSSNFGALLVDDKGRTVPAVVQVWEEDIPKLAEGKAWRLLIDTDDPRWNLEEQ
jgi:hypothetical protein